MQNWKDLYLELCELINEKIAAIKWIDLWHNQVNFLDTEHPFPSPALFLSFRIVRVENMGKKTQKVVLQVTTRLFFETMADTYHGAFNQESALSFLDILTGVYSILHGSSGTNYSSMTRTGLTSEDTGSSGNLYMQAFECTLIDYSATKQWVDGEVKDVTVEVGTAPEAEPDDNGENMYKID